MLGERSTTTIEVEVAERVIASYKKNSDGGVVFVGEGGRSC